MCRPIDQRTLRDQRKTNSSILCHAVSILFYDRFRSSTRLVRLHLLAQQLGKNESQRLLFIWGILFLYHFTVRLFRKRNTERFPVFFLSHINTRAAGRVAFLSITIKHAFASRENAYYLMLLFQELRGMADSSSRKDIPASDAERDQANAHKTPDGAWAWIVCISGTLSVIITFGCPYNFGLLFPLLLDEFEEGKAKTGKACHSLPDWHILTYPRQRFPDSTSTPILILYTQFDWYYACYDESQLKLCVKCHQTGETTRTFGY